ncbi:BREX system P-loop protein BrxC [Planococcus sp. 4-30]|uniref:BREX system P-loop protein BrxC n=1 Tax=Planococcus sp. 4-30 TaxID=2874583 RepID=UPI001CBD86BA|nr:BREX system P-loop protein BrxC [Planococcus sp. 4-30]
MTKLNEILSLNLQEDIKNVIDLEDRSEMEIQQEIESYIVTEGIGRHLYSFTNQFTSNIKETGVWLSGFYGSGKSYFGKMLGYIIDNQVINGTPARERFIPRLKGVKDESLIENSIRNLEAINSRVIFLDVAKQNTEKGLAFTLFANFLKNLGFRDDIYGYIEFDLYIDGQLDEFKNKVKLSEGQEWDVVKTSNRLVAKVMRNVFAEMGYSNADYTETHQVYSDAIENFSASKFKVELEKYLKYKPEETLVFIFDEASEAISQKKFTLLDLEGISESLSSIGNGVWTIAIAQEKLDDVINNANVNRSQLTKVTDRFKTKIHLESTEVDVIIRSRLLHKTEVGYQQLVDFYKKNEGLISDATNLKSSFPTKTANADEFATYYPFHKYQFDLLQKFLFSSNALVATQIAARGMIITTFDILRKQMRDQELFSFTPAFAICNEAQTAPPIGLVNKYDIAKRVLNDRVDSINGEKLLKTIHLLADSEIISPTVENITKSYISDITSYYAVKPFVKEALDLLLEAKVLLLSTNNYKITSDLEGKLLEEMNDFDVELYTKKRSLINLIKNYKLFTPVANLNDGSDNFKFSVFSDQEDELTPSGSKHLKLTVYSLFNIGENRQDFIEDLKLETQNQKNMITLVPDNKEFLLIDKLIEELSKYIYMEEKYSNESDPNKRLIMRDFSIIREEKERELRVKIENAYSEGSLIYLFDEHLLNANSFKVIIAEIQRKMIKNIYTKRLRTGLSEALVSKIFTSRKEGLNRLFTSDDFKFFDSHGNFTGEHLKVVEEISAIIKTRFVDGRSLEAELSEAPWGYSFGTIVSTMAVLFRAGRLSIKFNGETWFSYNQNGIQEAFTNATKFKSASFKSITATLTAAQKNQVVQILMDLEIDSHTGQKIDWSTSDFDLADSIRNMAEIFIKAISNLNDTVDRFGSLFPTVTEQKQILLSYSGKVTESNYIEKVEYFLANNEEFSISIQTIQKSRKFIKKNLSKVKDYERFIKDVSSELKKADRSDKTIQEAHDEFIRLYKQDMVKNFGNLQQQVQIVKDSYYKLVKNAAAGMSHEYQLLNGKVDSVIRTLDGYPIELNTHNHKKLNELKRYCSERIINEPVLEYSISCKNCGYSLADILNYTALSSTKANELLIIQNSFVVEAPKPEPTEDDDQPPAPQKPRKVRFEVPKKIMTVQEYKSLLTAQLAFLAAARPDEEIEIDIETNG